MNKKLLKASFINTLPVLAGYMAIGISFGILLSVKGYGVLWALAMSLFIYAGSMQILAIDLLGGAASLISAAILTLMVNARHLFYGISMIDKYKGMGKKKPYLIFALTDETYSLVCSGKAPGGVNKDAYFLLVSLFNHCYWIVGSVIGSLIGSMITFNSEGLEFAMTALFVTVFVEQWRSTKNHIPALVGVATSVVCLIIFGAGNFLIPTMMSITLVLGLLQKKIGGERGE